MTKFKKYYTLFIISLLFLTSCVSKKQVLYMQDLNSTDVSQVSIIPTYSSGK